MHASWTEGNLSIAHGDASITVGTLEAAAIRQKIDEELPLPKLTFEDLERSLNTGRNVGLQMGFEQGYSAAMKAVTLGILSMFMLYLLTAKAD